MWIYEKHGNPVNTDQIFGLAVGANGDEGGYEVWSTNDDNTSTAQFLVTPGVSMTLAEATALRLKMAQMLGVVDLSKI